MARIRFEKIRKGFDNVSVIRETDLMIEDGEFFTFVGPSGCGKSTILNMIAGLEAPGSGNIYFDDDRVNELSPSERDVAMVFQNYALYPHMSVYQNIAFPLVIKKVKRETIGREVKKVAALLGLEELLARKPKELSGGQQQRVALGRAIVRKPRVFLMDEPLSNLDARLRIETKAELKRLHQELRITTVYVTHDQAEAMSLSDRIAVLQQGEVQQVGTPLDVYLKPANIFVAGFIGSPPMNFIPASVRKYEPLKIDCNGTIFSPRMETAVRSDKLIIGIRPENVKVSLEKSERGVEITVSLIESAGSFSWVDVLWNNVKIKGISPVTERVRVGEQAFVEFPEDQVLVFDADSGRRL